MNTVLTQLIAGIFKPAAELIDEIHTSTEEKIEAKTRMLAVQASIMEASGMSPGEYEKLWTLIQLGIGGYVGGRSVEKIVKIVKAG